MKPGNDVPDQILTVIASILCQSDESKSAATLLRCSKRTCHLVAPFLYRDITLTRNNSTRFFLGLKFPCVEAVDPVHKGGPFVGPENALWPDIPLPDDEAGIDDDETVDEYEADDHTDKRKRHLLSLVRQLVVHESPPLIFSCQLCYLRYLHSHPYTNKPAQSQRILPRLTSVRITAEALAHFAEWQNRNNFYRTRGTLQPHPFMRFLAFAANP